jgi:ubiquinone/menaquinone biosynthesis C-methylase UbiE
VNGDQPGLLQPRDRLVQARALTDVDDPVLARPGYLAIEMARRGFSVTGLDVSRTLVEIASANAAASGVEIAFGEGDAAGMPFEDDSFDLVVCQAAFKNFARPAQALDEFHRVLRPGGVAIIDDMRRDASGAEIAREVEGMELSRSNALMTRMILAWLRRRAHSTAQLERLVAAGPFRTCEIVTDGISMEVRLRKPA